MVRPPSRADSAFSLRLERLIDVASMPDRDPDPNALDDLDKRLRQARGRIPVAKDGAAPSQMGIALRLSTELVAAVVVGGAVGWALDRVFGTSPILLLVMFFFGVAAGFRNVIRAAQRLNETPPGK